ncbi:low temperature requirement protein A [Micromonospora globbae]
MARDRERWSRGYGVALLRKRESAQQATYVELFFDLVMVFALNRLVSSGVADLEVPGQAPADYLARWAGLGRTLLLFAPLLWTWTITAYLTARFDPRTPALQRSTLVAAFAVLIMGTSVPHAFDGAGGLSFALAYTLNQVGRLLIFVYIIGAHPLGRLYVRATVWLAVGGAFWILGGLTTGGAQVVLWILAVIVDFGAARLGWPLPRLGRGRQAVWEMAPHHLAERYQQLMLIALGETILAVGITFTTNKDRPGGYESLGLLTAFVTTVLLWRIYFQRAGQVLGEAAVKARNPGKVGGFIASAHTLMIFGIVITAIGYELVQHHPLGYTFPAWLAMILGGPACFLVGRAALERAVFSRVSRRRWIGIGILLLTFLPLVAAPPLAAGVTAAAVLFGIAYVDTRRAAHRPPEEPHPLDARSNWPWWSSPETRRADPTPE